MMSNKRTEDNFAGARILIADDEPDLRQMLVRRAAKMGLSVVEAEDGSQAIETLSRDSFDLIIVDLHMPGKNGLEVIQATQEIDPDVPTILITGGGTMETAVEALRAGVYDFLTKPLDSLTIFDVTVKRALRQRFLEQENKRLFSEIQRLATTDQLTGLYNRHKLSEVLEQEVARAKRYDRPLSLIMLDLDAMKSINDTYGHLAGDQALCIVSKAIQSELRQNALPARIGGDEFVALLPEADAMDAAEVAKRIVARLAQCEIRGQPISVSVGVTQWSSNHIKSEDLIQSADKALYHSKGAGGQRVTVMNVKPKAENNVVA